MKDRKRAYVKFLWQVRVELGVVQEVAEEWILSLARPVVASLAPRIDRLDLLLHHDALLIHVALLIDGDLLKYVLKVNLNVIQVDFQAKTQFLVYLLSLVQPQLPLQLQLQPQTNHHYLNPCC